MISNKARYALRSLIFLAERHPRPASIAEIAAGARSPRKFLETILLELKLDGILDSRRGRMGGYELARPASEITVADILRSVDGPLALAPCASRTAFKPCDDCNDIENCRIRHILLEGRDALAAVLEGRKLADLAKVPSAHEELS
ncbi:MAG: RrF2 family transcriptional regulator [Brevundimonas sp.]|uniref:RrF2 family transcriptional regulator n=1 Tax=Brevundimonas sp. TaxID=1871086 RepID=UPI00391D8511